MFFVYRRDILGALILNYLMRIALPKSFANELGNVVVLNGHFVS